MSTRIALLCQVFCTAVVCLSVTAAESAQTTATWTGGAGTNSYNNPGNWDIGVVPINTITDDYVVVIGSGVTVNYDVPDGSGSNNAVTQFSLAAGSTINLQGRNLVVQDTANVAGKIEATSGSLTAAHLSGTLAGDRAILEVNTSANPADSANITLNASGTYTTTNSAVQNASILAASGSSAVISLPYLSTINSYTDHWGTNTRTISATNGGQIDLSGVTLLRGGSGASGGTDSVRVVANTGGTVDLSNLQQIDGYVTFAVDASSFTLPSLTHAGNVSYELPNDALLILPKLLLQSGGGFAITSGTTVNAEKLEMLNNAAVSFSASGAFNAPLLTDFAGSVLTLTDSAQTVTTAGLSQIDNARFILSNATSFDQISDSDYIITSSGIANTTVMSATGMGTVLRTGSLTKIDSYTDHWGTNTRTISATNGGQIDLSGVTLLRGGSGASGGTDSVRVVANTGGVIDLRSLTTVQGYTYFEAVAGGILRFGNLAMTSSTNIKADGLGSKIDADSLMLDASANVDVANGAKIQLAGSMQNDMTNAAAFNMDTGILNITGSGSAWLEVAGQDQGDSVSSGNFGMMQLVVGSASDAVSVYLTDIYDNDALGQNDREALYLFGSGGIDGLEIYGGSRLVLGDVPVYAFLDGSMVELHTLFAPGETVVSFNASGDNNGYLVVPEPSTFVLLLVLGGFALILMRSGVASRQSLSPAAACQD